jgi:monoamine oxidase
MSTGRALTVEKVIITVPLGVLQNKSIRFTPALPNHQRAFGQIGFGGVVKVFLLFREAFWENNIPRPLDDVAFIFSDAVIPTWWSQRPARTPLLTGWLGGPSASELNHDTESIINAAIQSLQYIFNCSQQHITREIRDWHIADWVKDPYALGAYAYPTIQTRKAREFLSQPVKDTLYFAGEALYNGPAMGTVEAALVNGEEVAKKIGA